MPLPTNNSRPGIPYNPEQVLPNHNRYQALGKFPPTAQQLDGDFNGMVDLINTLASAVNDTAVGIFPGADNPLNAHKLPTTDGQGNVSWTHVTSPNLTDHAVQTRHLQEAVITPPKIQARAVGTNHLAEGAVSTSKLKDNAVTTGKIMDRAITTPQIADKSVTRAKLGKLAVTSSRLADGAVKTDKLAEASVTTSRIKDAAITTAKVADNAVTTAKVADKAITLSKLNSAGARAGTILTADGAGSVSFLANKGRILQIVSLEDDTSVLHQHDASATPQNPQSFQTGPLLIRITPQKNNSKILIFYSINVGTYQGCYNSITLCKNDEPFKIGTAIPGYAPVTHSSLAGKPPYSREEYGCQNFTSLFIDTGVAGQEIVYEIKKSQPHVSLNTGYSGGYPCVSVIHAIEIYL